MTIETRKWEPATGAPDTYGFQQVPIILGPGEIYAPGRPLSFNFTQFGKQTTLTAAYAKLKEATASAPHKLAFDSSANYGRAVWAYIDDQERLWWDYSLTHSYSSTFRSPSSTLDSVEYDVALPPFHTVNRLGEKEMISLSDALGGTAARTLVTNPDPVSVDLLDGMEEKDKLAPLVISKRPFSDLSGDVVVKMRSSISGYIRTETVAVADIGEGVVNAISRPSGIHGVHLFLWAENGRLQLDIRVASHGAPSDSGAYVTFVSITAAAKQREFLVFPVPKFPDGNFPVYAADLRNGMRAGGGLIQYGQETGGEQRVDRIVMGDGAVQQVRRGIDVVADRYQFLLAGPLRLLQKGDRRPHIKENREFLDDHIRGTKEGEFWIVHPDDHLLVSGEEDVRLVKVRVPAPHVPSVTITGYNYARMSVILERVR